MVGPRAGAWSTLCTLEMLGKPHVRRIAWFSAACLFVSVLASAGCGCFCVVFVIVFASVASCISSVVQQQETVCVCVRLLCSKATDSLVCLLGSQLPIFRLMAARWKYARIATAASAHQARRPRRCMCKITSEFTLATCHGR